MSVRCIFFGKIFVFLVRIAYICTFNHLLWLKVIFK